MYKCLSGHKFFIFYKYLGTEFLGHMIRVCVICMSTLMPIPHYIYYWSFMLSLEFREYKPSIFFLCKIALDTIGLLNFHIHFKIILSISTKKICHDFQWYCIKRQISLGRPVVFYQCGDFYFVMKKVYCPIYKFLLNFSQKCFVVFSV